MNKIKYLMLLAATAIVVLGIMTGSIAFSLLAAGAFNL